MSSEVAVEGQDLVDQPALVVAVVDHQRAKADVDAQQFEA
jgi:hypothetical protein